MSQENVDSFQRAIAAYNRGDMEGLLKEHDRDVEWHPVLQVLLGGEATVYRGHEGVREFVGDLDEAFSELRIEIAGIRDLGDRLVGIGRLVGRGKESGAETETPIGWLVEYKNGKAARVMTYIDPKEALEAAGLSE
jgi:ketosteroid isomerase-like protein